MRLLALAFALSFALPGCIFQKGADDLSIVCEVKSESPGPAYNADGLALRTRVLDANLSAAEAKRLIGAAVGHVLTPGRHAHVNFSAVLFSTPEGERFHGEGYAANDTLVDVYDLLVSEEAGSPVAHETRPTLGDIGASPSMIREASSVVNRTSELASLPQKTPTLVATGWSEAAPSCVQLLYQDGSSDAIQPASPQHPHTLVVVSLVSDRVVLIKRDQWSA